MKRKELNHVSSAEFTTHQEKLHASVHVLGVLFGLIAVPLLILSAQHKDLYSRLAISVYGITFLMVFTFSTMYHACMEPTLKKLYKKLDRISIYFLIAGTYTPIIRFYLFDSTGVMLLWVLWSLVIVGILFEIFFPDRFPVFSILFYVFMGSICLFVPDHFFASMPELVARLIVTGLVFYITGVIFYVWQKWEYHHVVWHSFVLVASICHYLAVLYAM
ncbi:MAG: hemolysin [Segetibacter sp.]|nr:hemolysin [Segetibacter sp.]